MNAASRNASVDEVAKVIRMWQTTRDNVYIGDLLDPANRWIGTQAMPTAAELMNFQELVLLFVRLEPSLKLQASICSKAMLQLEQHGSVYKYVSAKTNSALLLKILAAFRNIAINPSKRNIIYRSATNGQIAALHLVCNLVETPLKRHPPPPHRRAAPPPDTPPRLKQEPIDTWAPRPIEDDYTPPRLKQERIDTWAPRPIEYTQPPMKRELPDPSMGSIEPYPKRSLSDLRIGSVESIRSSSFREHRIVVAHRMQSGKQAADVQDGDGDTDFSSMDHIFVAFEDLARCRAGELAALSRDDSDPDEPTP